MDVNVDCEFLYILQPRQPTSSQNYNLCNCSYFRVFAHPVLLSAVSNIQKNDFKQLTEKILLFWHSLNVIIVIIIPANRVTAYCHDTLLTHDLNVYICYVKFNI